MPTWTIYKDDHPIGQAKTWHKALDMLCKREGLTSFKMEKFSNVVFIAEIGCDLDKMRARYKISKM